MAKKDHSVTVIMAGYRFTATELNNQVTILRDGALMGKARWQDDQLVNNSAPLPDDVSNTLEKLLKEQIDSHWGED